MKTKATQFFLLLLIGVSVIYSCSMDFEGTPSFEVGEDFTDTSIRVVSIDTFTVKMSTMKFDSIITSNSGRLLFGKYNDVNFGQIKASSFFELAASSYNLEEDAVLDSIGLVLAYDNYFYNDTTQVLNLKTHKITERINKNRDNFYNTTQVNYDSSPISEISFYPEPHSDSLYIALPLSFGNNIFEDIQNNQIDDNESLLQVFKGFTIQPDDNNNAAIVGFDINRSYLKFYYSTPDEFENQDKELNLSINGTNYFNHIDSDVSNLPQENIADQEDVLLSTLSNNVCYLQSGVGYATRIEVPSLKNIYEIPGSGTILNATLTLKPNQSSYSDIKPIEETLNLYLVDQNNDLTEQVTNNANVVIARLQKENEEFNEIVYSIPMLEFVDRKLTEQPETEDALILIPNGYNSTVNSTLFNDAYNSDFKAELVITYAIYDD